MPIEAKHIIRLSPVVLLVLAGALLWLHPFGDADEPLETVAPDREYAGSERCQACHPREWETWSRSHHALAERKLDPERDRAALLGPDGGPRVIEQEDVSVTFRDRAGRLEVVGGAPDQPGTVHYPVRVIGVDPLWQLVVGAPRGRYQVTSFAYDPERDEWFDANAVHGWKPGEWGFWTGRGMTWNSMCAPCHTTRYEKRYDFATDSFDSSWLELGVGCEACHGPSLAHVTAMEEAGRTGPVAIEPSALWDPRRFREQIGDLSLPVSAGGSKAGTSGDSASAATSSGTKEGSAGANATTATRATILPPRIDPDRVVDTCGACHARHSILTGDFVAGDLFLDHFRPDILDHSDTFYADGQVRDEDYEYASFLSSRMYSVGVRCIHCHEPHSGKLRFEGDALCMSCHDGRIDRESHAHHPLDGPGGRCVDCHMPITVYMERDPRRDHGFTIPDPLLTREHGIPNACGRCHTDEDADWAVRHVDEWYGERMDRPTRERARIIARAKELDDAIVPRLIELAKSESSPFWRAVATALLEPWAHREDVSRWLIAASADFDALTRSRGARAMEAALSSALGVPPRAIIDRYLARLVELLEDPVRTVRLEAAWALRLYVDPKSALERPHPTPEFLVRKGTRAGDELERFLALHADQPAGLLQQAMLRFQRRESRRALPLFRRAAIWRSADPEVHRALAIALSDAGDAQGAVAAMREAHRLAPDHPSIAVGLGLALAEAGELEEAETALRKACAATRAPPRAWYNLAQVLWQQAKLEAALDAITKAIELDPSDFEALETCAILHRELGHDALAEDFARRAQETRERWRSMLER